MTSLHALFETVHNWPSSIAIRESVNGYPALLTTHVISMCLFAGLVIMMDLRLVGIGNVRTPFSQVQKKLFPWQMGGLAVSSITGLILVYGEPLRFYGNIFFWVKTAMMAFAGINAVAFHLITYRSVAAWDNSTMTPFGAKLAGGLSLFLWAGVIMTGRLIAYNWFN